VHSHNTSEKKNSIYHEVIRKIINFLNFDFLISHKIGCSDMATTWLFGKQSIKNYRAKTIYNGIDLEKFVINRKNKELERKQNNLNEGIHFIHIGRFHIQKNQKFLIDLFYEMLKIRKDIYLNIVGFGNLEATLKNYVNKLKLENHIFFYKYDTDIPSILRMMDYFLLPSLCEGLPITAIEAQVSNIPIFISESVTKEVDMGLAMFIPLSIGHKFWAQIILNSTNNYWINRCVDLKKLKLFDIKNVIKQFEAIYVISLHRRNLRM